MNNNCPSDKLPGVGCDAVNCKYHSADNACSANHITVENHSAMKKAETFCSTFTPRSSN